ncbi:enoyl-CoA hydratase-related protein [Streptomyces sp. NPDC093982]|uniref:enoyl-CoA hydratase-related protein n=1 Tax=Streptomyces sp. NPDC093982 TaxID=3155077 RepID=UPI00341A7311
MSDFEIQHQDRVVSVHLPGLHTLNPLNRELLAEVLSTLRPLDADPEVRGFVVVGWQKLAASDADVKRMAEEAATATSLEAFSSSWEEFARLRTPKIAAVDGYALGGGCELAMLCDIIIAGESAVFGQPQMQLGANPGAGGGTQRLPRLVGRAKAMDLILTGRTMGAREAEHCGLVSRVVADDQVLAEAAHVATTIAVHSNAAITRAREYVDQALETDSRETALFERRVFHSLFPEGQQHRARKIPQQRPPHFGS